MAWCRRALETSTSSTSRATISRRPAMFLSQTDAEQLARRALSFVQAPSCFLSLSGREDRNIRYASRGRATNASTTGAQISVTAIFGRRLGRASGNALDDDSVRHTVAQAEAVARTAPENPEAMPALPPQNYPASAGYNN